MRLEIVEPRIPVCKLKPGQVKLVRLGDLLWGIYFSCPMCSWRNIVTATEMKITNGPSGLTLSEQIKCPCGCASLITNGELASTK
ncbi:MAG: hypothetical protein A2Y38_13925 [Spirochaetes bacterium GWB1_59_5]|nr:MAG: hypothetical protein A2Y38_13925 [Spirochaetes bacterium GWB1_59_5]